MDIDVDVARCDVCDEAQDDCVCYTCGCGDQFVEGERWVCDRCGDCESCAVICEFGNNRCHDCCEHVNADCGCHTTVYDVCSHCEFCHSCCNCTMCDNCGDNTSYLACTDCVTCEDCGCQCGHGGSDKPGWEVRGIHVVANEIPWPVGDDGYDHACQLWKVDNGNIDPIQEMANFYLDDFVAHDVWLQELRRRQPLAEVADLVAEARSAQRQRITMLDSCFQGYFDMVIGGELRYHRAVKSKVLHPEDRAAAWVGWRTVRQTVGPQALLDAAELMREGGDGGIMGDRWAVAAEILHARITGQLDARSFVDRCFTLEHNGGCFFNKIAWARHHEDQWDIQAMTKLIGPAHACNPPQWGVLMRAASAEVRHRFGEYWRFAMRERRAHGMSVVDRAELTRFRPDPRAMDPMKYERKASKAEIDFIVELANLAKWAIDEVDGSEPIDPGYSYYCDCADCCRVRGFETRLRNAHQKDYDRILNSPIPNHARHALINVLGQKYQAIHEANLKRWGEFNDTGRSPYQDPVHPQPEREVSDVS